MIAQDMCCLTNQCARCDPSHAISDFDGFTSIYYNQTKNNM